MAAHSSVLAWRIPGTGGLVGCRLWGRAESATTEATQQRQRQLCHKYCRHRLKETETAQNEKKHLHLKKILQAGSRLGRLLN